MRIITKKTIKKECWNLDYELVKWLNEHLKVYKKDASKQVDLEYYTFTYKRKEYTQLEIIDRLVEITDYLKENAFDWNCDDEKNEKYKNEMYDLLKLIHWTMWW